MLWQSNLAHHTQLSLYTPEFRTDKFIASAKRCGTSSARILRRRTVGVAPLPATNRADSTQPSLPHICLEIQHGFFEDNDVRCMPLVQLSSDALLYNLNRAGRTNVQLCIQNNGRSAASSLTQVISATVSAFAAGFHLNRLRLELEHGALAQEGRVDSAGWRLTNSEQSYRSQWLDVVYITMQMDKQFIFEQRGGFDATNCHTALRSSGDGDAALVSLIEHTLRAHYAGDPGAVKFDRSLAAPGASKGVAAAAMTVAPQFVPVSQLVLLTLKLSRPRT